MLHKAYHNTSMRRGQKVSFHLPTNNINTTKWTLTTNMQLLQFVGIHMPSFTPNTHIAVAQRLKHNRITGQQCLKIQSAYSDSFFDSKRGGTTLYLLPGLQYQASSKGVNHLTTQAYKSHRNRQGNTISNKGAALIEKTDF